VIFDISGKITGLNIGNVYFNHSTSLEIWIVILPPLEPGLTDIPVKRYPGLKIRGKIRIAFFSMFFFFKKNHTVHMKTAKSQNKAFGHISHLGVIEMSPFNVLLPSISYIKVAPGSFFSFHI
jgi:hypothetical protein